MGIIKAFFDAMGGNLADQWAEVIEANEMSDTTVFTKGVKVRKNERRGSNKRGNEDVISNGSIVHVYPGQFMMLVDGGKVVDFTAEEGYYKVDNSSAPSLFSLSNPTVTDAQISRSSSDCAIHSSNANITYAYF